ncbi:glycosyltransferase [Aliifodinibius sp. S!AR15-10]|uniref:glycosyltransferase n=1 Tax=Aliifodinibius sp. S!AR15-10 TaxID=2950437 RepID=UPI00285F542E|nr:glycosyltransferase [Aliifodinibius sp. S!AR15-10]MDR8392615.1 glycosyltransferase [Aliifodinibius sp. S!AR15-10]
MDKPFVSVVTPVFNAEDTIEAFLNAVTDQSYPREDYEVIVVDNGSTDNTMQLIEEFQEVRLLERTDTQTPYAARNTGLEAAVGEVLILLDVNCTPRHHWLEEGIKCLSKQGTDLVGGKVSFMYSEEETLGEWYDSLLFVDMEDLIDRGDSCAAGNLFFKRKVWEKVGRFPETERSGMDLYWTKKATREGFKLKYCEGAEVRYPARKLKPLLKKVFRVGTGQPKVWLENGMSPIKMFLLIFYQIIPPGLSTLKQKIKRRGKEEMKEKLGALWLIHYLQQLTISLGWAKGFIRYYSPKS